MTGPALSSIGFIVGTLLNLYAMVAALRFVMQAVRADYFNPIAQFIVKATDPLLVPMRRVIPSIAGHDTSSLLLAFIVLVIKLLLFKLLALGSAPAAGQFINTAIASAPQLVYVGFVDLVHLLFNIFIFSLFIQALLSWLPAAHSHPVNGLLYSITSPILNPIRRFVPPLGGLDLSTLVAIIGLYAVRIFVVGVLMELVSR